VFLKLFIASLILLGHSEVYQVKAQLSLVPFNTTVQQVIDITHAGDERLFLAQKNGLILITDLQGNLLPDPFLDIRNQVISGGEQGLLGLVFSPEYFTDGLFYINYTNLQGDNTISRFSVSSDKNIADVNSEEILFNILQPFGIHNAGSMRFGHDGMLYITSGDGGAAGDPFNKAQDLSSRLGKILRIDVRHAPGYGIPSDNPYYNSSNAEPMIWSSGLRNPWRISFDRHNGDLWIGDVGENLWEEIDHEKYGSPGGENYGWRCYEGFNTFNTTGCQNLSFYTPPVYEDSHSGACSVTGGYVYRGAEVSDWFGKYFFTDYCSGKIQSLHDSSGQYILTDYGKFSGFVYSTFGEDLYGNIYIGKNTNGVFKLVDTTSCDPVAHISDGDSIVACGPSYSFTTPMHPGYFYQWFFNGALIKLANANSIEVDKSGDYMVQVWSPGGCSSMSKSVNLDLKISAEVMIQTQKEKFCWNDPAIKLDVSPPGGMLSGVGVSSGYFYPSIAGRGTHKITYKYTDGSNCDVEASRYFRVDSCGAHNLGDQDYFQVLDNLAYTSITLLLLRDPDNGSLVRVSDLAGRIVYEKVLANVTQGDKIILDLPQVSSGLYIVSFERGSYLESKKVMVLNQ
jgi:glucose/arabinose dehydrogenase